MSNTELSRHFDQPPEEYQREFTPTPPNIAHVYANVPPQLHKSLNAALRTFHGIEMETPHQKPIETVVFEGVGNIGSIQYYSGTVNNVPITHYY